MKYFSKKTVLLLLTSFSMLLAGAQPILQLKRNPLFPGEREASVVIDPGNALITVTEVAFYYSTNQGEVANNTSPKALAKLKAIGGGKLKAEFIFPHSDHMKPNTANLPASVVNPTGVAGMPNINSTDVNARVYNASDPEVHYKWVVKYREGNTIKTVTDEMASLKMPRFLIIAYAGDSYAAGEGAPDAGSQQWIDENCHRSEKSGGIRAIKKLIAEHPEFAVRYINVTCSGAEIDDFISSDIRNGMFGIADWSRKSQLLQIEEQLRPQGRKTVDLFLMSVGGNDLGFGPIGTSSLLAGTTELAEVQALMQNGLSSIATAYDALNFSIHGQPGYDVGRVIIMNYPDPTRGSNGDFCGPTIGGNDPFDCWGVLEKRLSKNDFQSMHDDLFIKMNAEVKKAADRNGWDIVDVATRSKLNGLCNCGNPYFNTLGQSMGEQGDERGTLHPNATGYRLIYRDAVYQQLLKSIGLWHEVFRDELKAVAKEKARQQALQKQQSAQTTILARKKYQIKLTPVQQVDVKKLKPNIQAEDRLPSKDPRFGR